MLGEQCENRYCDKMAMITSAFCSRYCEETEEEHRREEAARDYILITETDDSLVVYLPLLLMQPSSAYEVRYPTKPENGQEDG